MLAIVGGTGLYELPGMHIDKQDDADTPFGAPSGPVVQGRLGGQALLFLARHGAGHQRLPHEINYRANVFALKRAGATMMLGFSAVGSLTHRVEPGHLAMPSQYIDFTRGQRRHTFFGEGVAAHVSTADPVSATLTAAVAVAATSLDGVLHQNLTYACVEGPRLGTRAESHFFRQAGCHLVGMTNVPEVFLAREAQMAYATVGLVTDYDCWMEDPTRHANVATIFEQYGQTLAKGRQLLERLLSKPLPQPEASTRTCLATSMVTRDEALRDDQRAWLEVLRR